MANMYRQRQSLPLKALCYRIILLALLLSTTEAFNVFGGSNNNNNNKQPPHEVRICQNKDCCRQWTLEQTLPETLQDLLPPDVSPAVQVQVTSCLSQCGKGPNVMMIIKQQQPQDASSPTEVLLQGVDSPSALAAELQLFLGIRVPSKLLAAVTVMEKARKGTLYACTYILYGYNIRVASLFFYES